MRFIGITGGVGAGKSTILDYMEKNANARILKADDIAKELCETNDTVKEKLKSLFYGADCFDAEDKMDRERVAQIIFGDNAKRAQMEAIIHPAVKQYVLEQAEKEKISGQHDYLILEAALLIEEHYDEICDELWYVYTSEANRRARLKESRHYTDEKIDRIFANQLSEQEYRVRCKAEIDNNESKEKTIQNLQRVLMERSRG